MYFDFDDNRPEIPLMPRPLSRREGVLLSIIVHLLATIGILIFPDLPFVRALVDRQAQAIEQARMAALERQREQRFVFVQPRMDIPAPQPKPFADLSDENRVAQAPERAQNPTNRLPFSRGNTPERIELLGQEANAQRTRTPGAGGVEQRAPSDMSGAMSAPVIDASRAAPGPSSDRPGYGSAGTLNGPIGDALKNLDKYIRQETFNNQQGGVGEYGPSIQFDTKGVEFGPWIRRFIAQIRRNWFIPYAAMSLKGHVVLTFNVHKDGRVTDLTVLRPSAVEAFTNSAYNALFSSNPTQPLPPEYPDAKAFFTVTFYYNETPPQQQ